MSPARCDVRTELESDGQQLHITLDAPKANILDDAMLVGISEALDTHVTPHTKAVVFEGAGRHFSFGASVAEHTADRFAGMFERFHGLFRQLSELAIPTCAIVRGQCLGGGLELAGWCTWIVAAPEARLGQPEIKLGVFPPMASLILPWRAGGGAALDLCVSGRSVDAETALRMGVVTAVAEDPAGWWDAFFAEHVAPLSAASLRYSERATRASLTAALAPGGALEVLERSYAELMTTYDANEGIASFMERRPARFEDR